MLKCNSDGSHSRVVKHEIPLMDRVWCDPNCRHEWWEHTCCCQKILGAVMEERFRFPRKVCVNFDVNNDRLHELPDGWHASSSNGTNSPITISKSSTWDYAQQAEQDLLVLVEEEGATKAKFVKALKARNGTAGFKGRQAWPNNLDFTKVTAANVSKAQCRLKKFKLSAADRFYETWETKHPCHEGITGFARTFTFGQYGTPAENFFTLADPFHLWLNSVRAQDWKLALDMFTAHGELRELQLWLMSGAVKLPHIQVTTDDEYGECWVEHVKNDDLRAIKDKPHSRSDPTGNECIILQKHLRGAASLLLITPTDQKRKCHDVLCAIADHGAAMAKQLKELSPSLQDPTPLFQTTADAYFQLYIDHVCEDLGPGGHIKDGIRYLTLPAHIIRCHCPKWVAKLYIELGLRLGALSCQNSESANGKVGGETSNNTNSHLSVKNLRDNMGYQVQESNMVQMLCFPDTVNPRKIAKENLMCTRCDGHFGHRTNNIKECPLHPEHRCSTFLSTDSMAVSQEYDEELDEDYNDCSGSDSEHDVESSSTDSDDGELLSARATRRQ